ASTKAIAPRQSPRRLNSEATTTSHAAVAAALCRRVGGIAAVDVRGYRDAAEIRLRRTTTELLFFVTEESAAADEVGDLRGNHLLPAFVAFRDTLEHVA